MRKPHCCCAGERVQHASGEQVDLRMHYHQGQGYETLSHRRQWSGGWYACCGDCDGKGCGVFCVGLNLPYVLFGWSKARGFAVGGLKWGILYCLLLAAFYTASFLFRSIPGRYYYLCITDTSSCRTNLAISEIPTVLFGSFFLATGLGLFFLGCRNRVALRENYGIQGDTCKDCSMWFFCAPGALCQETRTLMDNNVDDGVWLGPDVMKVPKESAVV